MLKRRVEADGFPLCILTPKLEVCSRLLGFLIPGTEKIKVGGSADCPPVKPFAIVTVFAELL